MGKNAFIAAFMLAIMILLLAFSPSHAQTDSWVSKAPMQVARTGLGVAVVDGRIYAIGGSNQTGSPLGTGMKSISGTALGTNEQYDPATNQWTFKAPMPTLRYNFGIAISQNKIYCIGGFNNSGESLANEVYDPLTDKWVSKAPLPVFTGFSMASNVADKIYVIGGSPTSMGSGGVNEVYDPATDTWTNKTPPINVLASSAQVAFEGKIYLLGGYDILHTGSTPYNQIYNPSTDAWTLGSYSILGICCGNGAVTSGVYAPKRIYLMGSGSLGDSTSVFPVGIYDPSQDNWTMGTSMLTYRIGFGIGVVNDLLYVIGGQTFNGDTNVPSPLNELYMPVGYVAPASTPTPTPSPTLNSSSTQTPSPMSTATPTQPASINPSPTIPEFPAWIIPPLSVVAGLLAYFSKHRGMK